MKTFLLFVFLCASLMVEAQPKVKLDSLGNYSSMSIPRVKGVDTATGKMYTDSKGIKYPVYKTSTGRIVYHRISKNTGKEYKVYLDAK